LSFSVSPAILQTQIKLILVRNLPGDRALVYQTKVHKTISFILICFTMKAVPLVRASVILPIVQFLDHIGAPTERLMQRVNLPFGVLRNPETLIPLTQCLALGDVAARSEGLENFAMIVAQQTQFADMGAFGALACQSLTLHDLLQKMLKLHRAFNSGEDIWLTEEDGYVWFHHQYTLPPHIPIKQGQYYAVPLYLSAIHLVTGPNWQPDVLHLSGQHKLKGFLEADSLGNTQILFHQQTDAFRFPKSLLSKPLIHPTRSTSVIPEESFNRTAPAADFTDSLSQLIRSLLSEGYPNLAIAAESTGMSVRTFQRRLEDNNLSYSDLVDQIRFERATQLLQDRSIKLIDIAFELGYTEPANFTKAFKRWTGVSPRQFRNLHLEAG
jgi:AraC-like DNA-binding protein